MTELNTGWLPPLPDMRDYYPKKIAIKLPKELPAAVDLRQWFLPVQNQGKISACTAHAAVGIVEYFQNRLYKKAVYGSRLFVYKNTRNLLGITGNKGAYLRTAMAALCLCGVPPEKFWPYEEGKLDESPDAFVYTIADNFEAVQYFCHDPIGQEISRADVLHSVKSYLAVGVPAMFGFYMFTNAQKIKADGLVSYPTENDRSIGGHAVVACGYDDARGALLFRNSWGIEWGDNGYGWLPYEFVLKSLAIDFWSLVKAEWVDLTAFGL
jgi:C1A family cysteine protease